MKQYDSLIIDISNLHYRAYYGDDKMNTTYQNRKLQTQGITGCLKRINAYKTKYLKEGGTCYFLFDDSNGGTNPNKAESDYKATRKKESKAFYRSLDYLHYILMHYSDGDKLFRSVEVEADDWVNPIVNSNLDKRLLMISTDMDFARSISETVHWYSWHNGKVFTPKEFEEKYKFYPTVSGICFYKSFKGDKSDNIEGRYPQISPKKLKYVVENFKNMKHFLQGCREHNIPLFSEGVYNRMEREKHYLTNNWELVSFKLPKDTDLNKYVQESKVNILNLTQIYKGLSITLDKRVLSNTDLMDSFFEKKLTQRV